MQQVIEWITQNQILTGLFVLPIIGVIIRAIPKQKLMNLVPEEAWKSIAGKLLFGIGVSLSKFGNTKIGKKAMNKLEEGVLSTLVASFMSNLTKLYNIGIHALVEFGRGLKQDNEAKDEKAV